MFKMRSVRFSSAGFDLVGSAGFDDCVRFMRMCCRLTEANVNPFYGSLIFSIFLRRRDNLKSTV